MFVTTVLGTDGSGKSTVAAGLAQSLSWKERTCLIGDRLEIFQDGERRPVEPLVTEDIRRWVSARARRARSLRRYKLPKFAELLLRDRLLQRVERRYRPGICFADGMPALNLCAWSVFYHPDDFSEGSCARMLAIMTGDAAASRRDPLLLRYPELRNLQRLHLNHLHLPHLVLLLDVPPVVCVKRIQLRGKPRQIHETEEKLEALRRAYQLVGTVLARNWKVGLKTLDGDRPLDAVLDEARDVVETHRGKVLHGAAD